MDCNLPGYSVHGIFQARTLEWVAILFSRESSLPRDGIRASCISGSFFTNWPTREAPEWEALPLTHYVTSNSPELLWIHSLSCKWADWNRGSQGPSLVASLVAQTVKHLPSMQETQVRSLGQEDPLEKEMATHFSILAWRISRTEEPAGYSPWGCKESDTTKQLTHTRPFQVQYLYSMLGELKHTFYSRNIYGKSIPALWWTL